MKNYRVHPTHWLISTQVLACLSGVAWGRYQVAYLNSLGIAPSTLGALRAAGLAAKFFCTPLWGAWADARPGVAPLLAAIAATASLIRLYQSPTVVGSLPLLFALKAARSAAKGRECRGVTRTRVGAGRLASTRFATTQLTEANKQVLVETTSALFFPPSHR